MILFLILLHLHYIPYLFKITAHKMAPFAFFFAAAGIKIMRQYFLINGFYLVGNFGGILRCDQDLFFMILAFIYGLNKIKNGAYNLPVVTWVVIDEQFIKHSLAP